MKIRTTTNNNDPRLTAEERERLVDRMRDGRFVVEDLIRLAASDAAREAEVVTLTAARDEALATVQAVHEQSRHIAEQAVHEMAEAGKVDYRPDEMVACPEGCGAWTIDEGTYPQEHHNECPVRLNRIVREVEAERDALKAAVALCDVLCPVISERDRLRAEVERLTDDKRTLVGVADRLIQDKARLRAFLRETGEALDRALPLVRAPEDRDLLARIETEARA